MKIRRSLAPLLFVLLGLNSAHAGSATWKSNPASGVWTDTTNWSGATIPNGISDRATFARSNKTDVSVAGFVLVKKLTFTAPATNPFTITVRPTTSVFNNILAIGREGIVNDSGRTQSFEVEGNELGYAGQIVFSDIGTAGRDTTFTTFGAELAGQFGGFVVFQDTSSAGESVISNNPGLIDGGRGGETDFVDNSSAAHAILIAHGGQSGKAGGTIRFYESSTGDFAGVELLGNGNLDISGHDLPGLTIGFLTGDGEALLGGNNLAIGGDNSSSAFAGTIKDGGVFGGGNGSLAKIGSGTMSLTGASSYTGGTTVTAGTLIVGNATGSATGSGPVRLDSGILGGAGTIAGTVTIGQGSGGGGAFLAPAAGTMKQAVLTTQSALIFKADATYTYTFKAKRDRARTDGVTANGARSKAERASTSMDRRKEGWCKGSPPQSHQ